VEEEEDSNNNSNNNSRPQVELPLPLQQQEAALAVAPAPAPAPAQRWIISYLPTLPPSFSVAPVSLPPWKLVLATTFTQDACLCVRRFGLLSSETDRGEVEEEEEERRKRKAVIWTKHHHNETTKQQQQQPQPPQGSAHGRHEVPRSPLVLPLPPLLDALTPQHSMKVIVPCGTNNGEAELLLVVVAVVVVEEVV
jgi:hypothetical protein